MKLKELLMESGIKWYRGVKQAEYDAIIKSNGKKLPKPSAVPIPFDNMVINELGWSEEEAEEAQTNIKGEKYINVTRDINNARGYGDNIIWFESSLVNDYGKGYGIIDVKWLKGQFNKSWGFEE